MTNDLPGENNDQSDVRDSRFSSLSNIALGAKIGLEYEGSMDIDYESFLIDKVISLGGLDEEAVRKVKSSSDTTFTDPLGNVYSEKLAHYVEAFWNSLDEKERIILEEDLKEAAALRPRVEEFKEPGFSEQLFENEEGMNKFVGIIGNNLRKALLVSLLTGRECKYEIYKDNHGRYFCDSFPRIGNYGEVGGHSKEQLQRVFLVHTHPTLTDYDATEKKFDVGGGFSYNPAPKGDLDTDDRSDWAGFLSYPKNRGVVEGVINSNEQLTLLKFCNLDVNAILRRARDLGKLFDPYDINLLRREEEGVCTNAVVRYILAEITDNQYLENIDEKLSKFFGYNLYKGNLEKVENVK
jgi:hypothetical protein